MDNLLEKALDFKAKGQRNKAIETLELGLLYKPQDVYIKYNLAALQGDLGNFTVAASLCEELVKGGFKNYATWLVLARAYLGKGDLKNAFDTYMNAKLLLPNSPELHRELSQLLWMMTGSSEDALSEIESAITEHPDDIALHLVKIEIMGYVGLRSTQLKLARELIFRFPNNVNVKYLYSRVALKSKHFDDAARYASDVYKLSSNNPDVIIHYANCLLACGNEKLGNEIVSNACTLFPNNQHLKAIQTTLWRLLGDPRYEYYCNYDKLVIQGDLYTPKGWNSLENYIADLEAELQEAHKFKAHPFGQSVRKGSQVAFVNKSDTRAMQSYDEALIGPVRDYLRKTTDRCKIGEVNPTLLGAWSVKLFNSGHHKNHVHQNGWLSSVCHLRFPSTDDSFKEGWLKIGEPGMVTSRKLCAQKYIQPKKGQVVIFPSYVWHGTVPINGNDERLSVAADINNDKT